MPQKGMFLNMKNTIILKKNYEFKNVLTRGKYYAGCKIEAFIQSGQGDLNRLGLAIGVKRGKAVQRNRIKRLLKESYHRYEPKIKTGNNIVFLSKKSENLDDISFADVLDDMEKIFQNANIIKK